MSYLGDFALGSTFDFKFTTVGTTGAPATLAGSPAISAYLDNNTTELTAGITLSVDFDTRTGMHNVRVVATGGNGYASGSNYQLVITAGTVGGTSVVGYVVGEFSIEARSALRPTTAGRTLDVDASGGAEVGSFQSGAITNAAFAAGAIDNAAIATDAIGSAEIASSAVTEIQAGLSTLDAAAVRAAVGLASANTDTQLATIAAYVDTVESRLPAALDANGFMKAGLQAINADTGAANNLAKTTKAIGRGTASGVPTTTSIPTSAFTPAGAAADQFKGRLITFDADTATTALRGQTTDITASTNAAAPTFTVTALTTAPASGDTFSVT